MKKLLYIAIFSLTFGCVNAPEDLGYSFSSSRIEDVKEGITSKDKIIEYMGSPSFKVNVGSEEWVYVSQKNKKVLFFKPKITERQIATFKFNEFDTVKKMSIYTLNDSVDIDIEKDYTKLESHKKSIFKRFFSNLFISNVGS